MTHRPIGRLGAAVTAGAAALASLAVLSSPTAHAAAPVVLTPVQVDTSATRATGHNDFLADGVRVHTEGSTSTDKAAGYFDVDRPLAGIGEPSMDWSNNLPAANYRPGLQLKTDFNGDGDIDGILVGEPVLADGTTFLGNRWWLAGGGDRKADLESPGTALPLDEEQPSYRRNIATLDEWRTAYPDAQVLQAGWSLGSGALGDGTIYGITVADTEYLFSNDEQTTTETLYASDVDLSETRATGHNDFRATSGVRVWTEGATSTDKAAGYFPVGLPFARVGEASMKWRNNAGNTARPGMQLVVDVDGDGTPDGILVGEPVYQDIAAATNWWLTGAASQAFKDLAPSTDGGNGSGLNGTLAEWRAALPSSAEITHAGWSLGSGVKGDGVVESITVGLTTYTFTGRNRAPQAGASTVTLPAGTSRNIQLGGVDPDGEDLTFTVDGEDLPGSSLPYAAAPGFVGVDVIDYTVTDERGASAAGQVQVEVTKAATSASLVIGPSRLTARSTVRLRLVVESTGVTTGARVGFAVDGRGVGTAVVTSSGYARIELARKLTPGRHVIKVRYRGTTSTEQVLITRTVRVAR